MPNNVPPTTGPDEYTRLNAEWDALGVGVRVANCMAKQGITPDAATHWADADLLRLPNFGKKSVPLLRAAAPLRQDGTISVPAKLLREAHAVMRQCGWQLAPGSDDGSDGVLALAAAEVEEAFGDLLKGAKP